MALTDKEKQAIVKRYVQGVHVTDIEAEFGIGRSSLYFVLGQYGIKPARARGRNADARAKARRQGGYVDKKLAEDNIKLKQRVKELERQLAVIRAASNSQ